MIDRTVKQSPTKSKEYGYIALWKAVILQAVQDYRKHPEMRSEVAKFFKSEYFESMTGIKGQIVLDRLKNEVK